MRYFYKTSLVLAAVVLFSCNSLQEKKIMFQGNTQGTYYAITYFDRQGRDFQAQVDSILHVFDLSLSMWVPESIISRINNGDTLVKPDHWFRDIFDRSQAISAKTNGAFDVTVGPLVDAWGFGSKGKMVLTPEKVDSLRQYVDYREVSIDSNGMVVKPAGFRIDFNAIAQGYSVDVVSDFLASRGIKDYLIDIGGEVLGKGAKPGGKPWLVGIENPAADSLAGRTINTKIALVNKAVATSGSYRKYYEENGVRYSHTIDPATGYPVRHSLLSVSVLADDCATADGYATAFMVMGLDKSKEFLEKNPGMEAYFIISANNGQYQTYATKGFKEIISTND